MGKYLLFVVCGLVAIFLGIASITSQSSSAILAEVEPQRYAVSFPKAVRVKEIYVVPGQQVKEGDPLIKVERPDLLLERENQLRKIDLLSSNLEKKMLQKDNKLYLNDISFELRKQELENNIQALKSRIAGQQKYSDRLQELNLTKNPSADTILVQQLQVLEKEKATLQREYSLKKQEIAALYDIEFTSIEAEIEQLKKELELLKQEEQELIQYARVNGAIGNIYVEAEELVPAYTNLISVYEDNPTIIRAFTNEHQPITIESGMDVLVESTNRQYQIRGQVMEVGSRIIEYPLRLRTFDQRPSWGRELFIKIPKESKFLNGEKVFVILEK